MTCIGQHIEELSKNILLYFSSFYIPLTNLNNKPNCYKNSMNPPCIDLILTNSTKYF